MDEEVIFIAPENIEIVDAESYCTDVAALFADVPAIARPLVDGAKKTFRKIEQMLYSAPAFVNAIKAALPEETFQAILTDDQKQKLADGALKLMTKKMVH